MKIKKGGLLFQFRAQTKIKHRTLSLSNIGIQSQNAYHRPKPASSFGQKTKPSSFFSIASVKI